MYVMRRRCVVTTFVDQLRRVYDMLRWNLPRHAHRSVVHAVCGWFLLGRVEYGVYELHGRCDLTAWRVRVHGMHTRLLPADAWW
jgi:hypothetical protein